MIRKMLTKLFPMASSQPLSTLEAFGDICGSSTLMSPMQKSPIFADKIGFFADDKFRSWK